MSGYYPYGQSYYSYYPDEWLLQIFMGLLVMAGVFALLLCLALYIFRAIGLYKIAKRRALRCAWLAWVPVANDWVLGSISDQYQYVVKGRIKNRRFVMTIMSAAAVALGSALSVLSERVIVTVLSQMMFGTGTMDMTRLMIVVGLTVLCAAVEIAHMVFSLIAHYDLYSSCTEKYNVLYLVLAIFFRFLEPFFVFACRDKDEGMPPRRAEPVLMTDADEISCEQREPLTRRLMDLITEEVPEETFEEEEVQENTEE